MNREIKEQDQSSNCRGCGRIAPSAGIFGGLRSQAHADGRSVAGERRTVSEFGRDDQGLNLGSGPPGGVYLRQPHGTDCRRAPFGEVGEAVLIKILDSFVAGF
jgi:hypothetical protein